MSRARQVLVLLLGPLWVRTFRDPVREGHLRLDRLSRSEKQLARFGLVLLVLLLVSVLFADRWRAGTLLQLSGTVNELSFLPQAALPVTLLGLALSWALLCWGALDASPLVRVTVAMLYAATAATLSFTGVGLGSGTWILENVGALVDVGALGVPAALVLSAVLDPVLRSRPRAGRAATGVFRGAILVMLVVQYGALQWAGLDAERRGFPSLMPGLVDSSVAQISSYLIPLVFVAAITVVDFALDVSTSLTEPVRVLSRRWLFLALGAVLVLKLVVQVLMDWSRWVATVTYQPVAFGRTVVCVLALIALVAVVTRFPASEDYQLAKERAMYGSSLVLALSQLLSVIGVGAAFFVLSHVDSDAGSEVNDVVPYAWLAGDGLALAAVAAVAGGLLLMHRSAGGFGDELGSALVVIGAWCLSIFAPIWFGFEFGFSYPTVDLVVTLAVLVLVLLRWRTLSRTALVALITLLVFSWLVMSRGDYISFIGGLAGLPTILVVVFGVVLTLASGSAFAAQDSPRLPAESRPLMFVGYLLLSVVILHWLEVTHEEGQDQFSLLGFYAIGIPMGFWLAARRIVPRPDPRPGPGAGGSAPPGGKQTPEVVSSDVGTLPPASKTFAPISASDVARHRGAARPARSR